MVELAVSTPLCSSSGMAASTATITAKRRFMPCFLSSFIVSPSLIIQTAAANGEQPLRTLLQEYDHEQQHDGLGNGCRGIVFCENACAANSYRAYDRTEQTAYTAEYDRHERVDDVVLSDGRVNRA